MATFKLIRADQILIDPPVQRKLRKTWVKWLADNFDEGSLGNLTVSLRSNGKYYAVNGQHRIEAVIMRGEHARKLPCVIHEGLTKAEEASMFVGLNNDKTVDPFDEFQVRLLIPGDSARAIDKIIQEAGMKVTVGGTRNGVRCVNALEAIYDQSPDLLAETLAVVTAAWTPEDVVHLLAATYTGIALFLRVAGEGTRPVKLDRVIGVLQHFTPYQWAAKYKEKAAQYGCNHAKGCVYAIIEGYNKGLSSGKLARYDG